MAVAQECGPPGRNGNCPASRSSSICTRVDAGLVERPVRDRAHQQTQRRQIGPLGPGLVGEQPPQLGGPAGLRRIRQGMRETHIRPVPSHTDR